LTKLIFIFDGNFFAQNYFSQTICYYREQLSLQLKHKNKACQRKKVFKSIASTTNISIY